MPSALLTASSLLFAAASYAAFGEGRRDRAGRVRAGAAGEGRAARALISAGAVDRVDGVVVEPKPGKVAQIDHILLAPSGWLLVVETKNWAGIVDGGGRDQEWAVTKPSGETRRQRNPIFQAQRQARLLSQATGAPVSSIVLMVGRARHVSGSFPNGVVRLADGPDVISEALNGVPKGVRPDMEAARRGFGIVQRIAAEPGSRMRAVQHADQAEWRYGHHKWLAWLAMSVATAAAAWTTDPEPVLVALRAI